MSDTARELRRLARHHARNAVAYEAAAYVERMAEAEASERAAQADRADRLDRTETR